MEYVPVATGAIAGAMLLRLFGLRLNKSGQVEDDTHTRSERRWPPYQQLSHIISQYATVYPCGVVNLAAFDANTDLFADIARRAGKTLRLATKSVRVPALIERVLHRHPDVYKGLMCYCAREAVFWWKRGQTDILVAYPVALRRDIMALAGIAAEGCKILVTIDCMEHVALLEECCAGGGRLGVVVDIDMSYRALGGALQLGAHRSPCHGAGPALALMRRVTSSFSPALWLAGAMGYEAHVAGLPEWGVAAAAAPGTMTRLATAAWRATVSLLKAVFMLDVLAHRGHVIQHAAAAGLRLSLINGGGSGNLAAACADPVLTEVTVGSGLLQSHLFDGFAANRCSPALAIALQVTRVPEAGGSVCCQSGGFPASGQASPDKAPITFMPRGLVPYDAEGFGEVQTPLRLTADADDDAKALKISDPVFIRPAKAGEIAERFNSYIILCDPQSVYGSSDNSILTLDNQTSLVDTKTGLLYCVGTATTYRGLGHTFY